MSLVAGTIEGMTQPVAVPPAAPPAPAASAPSAAPVAATGPLAAHVAGELSWAARADRVARLVLLPLLGTATLLALIGGGGAHGGTHLRNTLVAGAALWSLALLRYPVTDVPVWLRRTVALVHIGFGAALVIVNPWFGVFALSGYFFADELRGFPRYAGYTMTAAVLAGSQTDGFPDGWNLHTVIYLVMCATNIASVTAMVRLNNRVLHQNTERGRMIDELAEANRRLAETMAENAALHAQLLLQAREAGVVEERRRLAGEIHDTLAQGLVGIVAQIEAARRAAQDPDEWDRRLGVAASLARTNLTDARRSVRALRPGQLERATLPEALTALVRDWSGHWSVPAQVETTGVPRAVDPDTEAALFRVAQEALANVAKHAEARQVHLTLSYLDDALLLDVADDGRGFTPPAPGAVVPADPGRLGGFGLPGMRARLTRLGGVLTIESAPAQGTIVNATLPLRPPAVAGSGPVPSGSA